MSATGGKVALVKSSIALYGICPVGLADLAGYGTTTTCFEGSGAAPAPSNTMSVQRTGAGTDTQNNSADFVSTLPAH
jgi:hypothetical protein